ncbi:MAG: helix-turn-helix domain-containing protein [Ferrovibrio sp.]|uniref:HVO_A0114 family putative DNA-binding protein n=1 Tax=Ferrovibrio sp. TaxID=1917215 RepID=UPI00391C6157
MTKTASPTKAPSRVRVTVGRQSLEAMGRDFLDQWHALEGGAAIAETHIHFQTLDDAARILSPKRQDLLKYLRRHKARTITEIAAGVKRSYKNVHQDVKALLDIGLLRKQKDEGFTVPFDRIQTEIRL